MNSCIYVYLYIICTYIHTRRHYCTLSSSFSLSLLFVLARCLSFFLSHSSDLALPFSLPSSLYHSVSSSSLCVSLSLSLSLFLSRSSPFPLFLWLQSFLNLFYSLSSSLLVAHSLFCSFSFALFHLHCRRHWDIHRSALPLVPARIV